MLVYVYAVVLTLVSLLCWVGILFSLPGTSLMILFPVLLVGPLLGACLGAFVGALLGNLWAGRTLFQSFATGRGAAIGQFWGTGAKLVIGAIIAVMLTIAACV